MIMWLAHEGQNSIKHQGWRHPVATFVVHYAVVAVTTTVVHDLLMRIPLSDGDVSLPCNTELSETLVERQQRVASFLAGYFCLYFAWRLALHWNTQTAYLLYPEFYRQTFLCSGTIFNASLSFFTGRPLIAEAFCIAVGIDQLLWYVDLMARVIWGTFPVGVTKYLFWPGTTWASRVTSTHHFWTIPLVMWATGGFHLLALPLSMFVVTVNVRLSRWMTPISIQFQGKGKKELYLNLNMAHELWKDIQFKFLLMGEDDLPYPVRLLLGWFLCNIVVFAFLYGSSTAVVQSFPTSC